jgi:hypothetical protein
MYHLSRTFGNNLFSEKTSLGVNLLGLAYPGVLLSWLEARNFPWVDAGLEA